MDLHLMTKRGMWDFIDRSHIRFRIQRLPHLIDFYISEMDSGYSSDFGMD